MSKLIQKKLLYKLKTKVKSYWFFNLFLHIKLIEMKFLWAAGLLGKSDDAAAEYAMSVVSADFEEAGIEDVVRKVAADLAGKASADDVRAKMAELLPVAKQQLMDEL